MKMQKIDDLLNITMSDRIWRIKEITFLKSACAEDNQTKQRLSILRRAFIPIAYAHWEGYAKKIGQSYLEYVASQNLKLYELSTCFQSMHFSNENYNDLQRLKRHSLQGIIHKITNEGEEVINLKTKGVITAQGNLNSDALKDICLNLGIDFSIFNSKATFIDKILIGKRNGIAHGEGWSISYEEVESISDNVINCIDIFKESIERAATSAEYLSKRAKNEIRFV
ncbi:MAE_28990/MAE_18760 family HEPN-like nuclease [Nitrospirillum sp. BR 11828]|uniref:MAE_28990/MAE_18760 family HEPN-like nuclease n=1 Tax=Nitrospirillum sp. BR 11828 TaxID=3104325 RepID=UPI002ACA69D3|nr:MAE_28990/MAE_18760 family HEPN-like nuclease [Nitrospirillum sp. BR 11828]MDZ5648000.1 MAE_28990/MAE_18760 family HEPN-like nuclease [Nitrospirillum sp. BR 11828]